MLRDAGTLHIVENGDDMLEELGACLSDPEQSRQRGRAGRKILDDNRGALDRLMSLVIPLVDRSEEVSAREPATG